VGPPAIWNVPYLRNPHFTGREDFLAALQVARTDATPVVLTQVLRGLGGIGKTQLALEYAYRYAGAYRLVWWVRAEEPATLAADYAALAESIQLPEHAASDQTETVAAVRRWLERHDAWLLILDNAPAPSAVHAYLPRSTRGHVIITSRHFGWGGTARSLTVPVLPRDEAVQLLCHGTQQADPAAAAHVAEILGDLPLALAQAAAYIEATGLTLAAYGARLTVHLAELLRRGEVGPAYPATVAMTWALAFQALQETQPAAGDLLRLCAFVAPEAILQALLRDDPSTLPAPLGAMVADDLSWDEALAALRRYALIDVEGDTLAVHRLVQAVTRDRLAPDERSRWAEVAVTRMAAAFPSGEEPPWEPRNWPTCARLLPHAVAVLHHAAEMNQAPPAAAFLCNQVGLYLHGRAQFVEAKPYLERALAIREAVMGPEHPDTAMSLNDLGHLLQAQGDLAGAKPYYERALAIREAVLGPQHPATARSLNDLGDLLRAQGDLAGARPYYERALAISEAVVGPEHPDTASNLNSLGLLLQAQGDLAGAKPYYERALEISEAVLGPEHLHTSSSLNNLGLLLQAQGDLAGAKPYIERALAIREVVLGPQHPDTATSLNSLGYLLRAQGDLTGAKRYYERALAIREAVLGPQHPDTATSLNNLGTLLWDQGDLAGAKPYVERALAICEQVLGPEHLKTASSVNNLGYLLQAQGDLAGAKPYYERALAIFEQVLGPEHPDATLVRVNYAVLLIGMQRDGESSKPLLQRIRSWWSTKRHQR
jgi:tetratricopeptide (TPR) repeat protein